MVNKCAPRFKKPCFFLKNLIVRHKVMICKSKKLLARKGKAGKDKNEYEYLEVRVFFLFANSCIKA